MSDYFYGWYFRCQGKEGSIAVIPAVHISAKRESCSIQIITESGSWNKVFPVRQFRINRGKRIMQIGENLFSAKGIRLNLETEGMQICGILRFGKFAEPEYDIMGPFRYIPGMECRHAVYSMRHSVDGELKVNGAPLRFRNGKGYMEGDSGNSFPEKYAWTQHFLGDGSLMLAAATVPLGRICFTGTVGILHQKGREYRFATYLGASVQKIGNGELFIRQGKYCLRVRFPRQSGNVLRAPQSGKMTRRIRESVSCRAEYTLLCGDRVVFRTVTDKAAFEYETKEDENENISNRSRKDKREIFKRRCHRIQ